MLYAAIVASDERAAVTMTAAAARPRWELRIEDDGALTAVLTGSDPPIAVSGESLASLRKQIGKIRARPLTR